MMSGEQLEAKVGFQWPVLISQDALIDPVYPLVHPLVYSPLQLLPSIQLLPVLGSFIQACRVGCSDEGVFEA